MFLKLILIKIDSLIDALKEIHEILLSFLICHIFECICNLILKSR